VTGAEALRRPRRRWVWVMVALATAAPFASGFRLQLVPKGGSHHEVAPPVAYRRNISDLHVQANGSTAVAIRVGPPGQVTVTSSLSWLFRKPTVSETWHGGSFWLATTCPRAPFGDCQASIVMSVPAGTAVQAQAGAGAVTVTGLTGPLHLSGTSGLLIARDVSGPVWATVTSGSVDATGLTSNHLSASASTGQLMLTFATSPQDLTIAVGAGIAGIAVPRESRYRIVRSGRPGAVYTAPGLSDAESGQLITVTVGSGEATIGYRAGSG
jgi:hypothetical protein